MRTPTTILSVVLSLPVLCSAALAQLGSASQPGSQVPPVQATGGFGGIEQPGLPSATTQTPSVLGLDAGKTLDSSRTPGPLDNRYQVLPIAYRTKMGTSNNRFPHAQHNMRYQQVFLGSEIGGYRRWTKVALRRDETSGGPALTQNLEVIIGDTTYSHTTITSNFNGNYRVKLPAVFNGNVNLPNRTGGGGTNSFDVVIPFNRLIIWGGSTSLNVIVEMINRSTSSTGHFEDACSGTDATTTRIYATSATATTGTIGRNYGLVMCLADTPSTGSYTLYGNPCSTPLTVLPRAYASKLGESSNRFPHAQHNMRYQQVFLGSEIGPSQTWTSVSLRRKVGGPALTQNLEVIVGDTTYNHTNITSNFNGNYRTKLSPVFSGNINLPSYSNSTSVSAFNITIPFNRPVSWGGPTSTVNLIVEIVNKSSSSTGHYEDACSASTATTTRIYASSATATTGTIGRNYGLVMALARPQPLLYNSGLPTYGGSFGVYIANAPASTAAVLWLGNRTAISLGATFPGCSLYATTLLYPLAIRTTSSSGAASVSLALPNDVHLKDAKFANQWLAIDKSAKNLIVFTNGGEGVVGGL